MEHLLMTLQDLALDWQMDEEDYLKWYNQDNDNCQKEEALINKVKADMTRILRKEVLEAISKGLKKQAEQNEDRWHSLQRLEAVFNPYET